MLNVLISFHDVQMQLTQLMKILVNFLNKTLT